MKNLFFLLTVLVCLFSFSRLEAKINHNEKNEKYQMPVYPLFNMSQIQRVFTDFIEARVQQEIDALTYIGEEFVNKARDNGDYTDRTGNLRSSIGYIIVNNGRIIDENFKQFRQGAEGISKAETYANEKAREFNSGLVLICFAGMEYAAAVESKNYDVISGSAPTADLLRQAFESFGLR